MLRSRLFLATLAAAALAAPLGLEAQQPRDVVGKAVSVGRSEAVLRLEFQDGDRLEIALRDGEVLVDDRAVGRYQAGDELDAAFRSLVGSAVALEDGPLSAMLREWSPPQTLSGGALETARALDRALEEALSTPAAPTPPDAPATIRVNTGDERSLIRLLLGQAGRLDVLQDALSGLSDQNVEFHVQEDVDIGADQVVNGTLVVIQADARVAGRVEGDVVVVDGRLDLLDGSRVTGDVRLVDARLGDEDGTVDGSVVDVLEEGPARGLDTETEAALRDRIRAELRSELRRELRHVDRDEGWSVMRPFRSTARAVGGVLENLLVVFFFGVLGVVVSAFAGPNLDVVAETARRAPGRAAAVGFAGSFLLIPVWVLGTVALAVSIVGIPVVIAWVPLFPLAAVAACVLGFLAVARNVGEWLADSDYRYTDWIRKTNPVYTIFGGLLALLSVFMLANLLRIVPFVGAVRGILTAAGFVALTVAAQIGFGAVLLTRAGRRREYYPADPDEAWRRAVDAELEVDDVDFGEPEGAAGKGGDDA